MYVQRELVKTLHHVIEKFPVMFVTGPRQSGKSMVLKNEFKSFEYINLEDPEMRDYALSDPKGLLRDNSKHLIIDEAQYADKLFSYIQLEVDNNPKAKYILSGSQNFLLHHKISQSLAGRVGITHLLPFSTKELSTGKFNTSNINELIFNGFYPRIYDQNIEATLFYPNYIQTYVERDVRTLQNISDLNLFTNFLRLCAGRIGQLINYTSMANDIGVSLNTIKKWVTVLKTSFIAFEQKPYYNNFGKRIKKSGKLYFYDTGLACSLLGLTNAEQVSSHFLRGGLFENYVILETIKHFYNKGLVPKIYFWQDSNGKEVDCIVEYGQDQWAIEIKSAKTHHLSFTKNLIKYQNLSKLDKSNMHVVYAGLEEPMLKGVRFTSWKNLRSIYTND